MGGAWSWRPVLQPGMCGAAAIRSAGLAMHVLSSEGWWPTMEQYPELRGHRLWPRRGTVRPNPKSLIDLQVVHCTKFSLIGSSGAAWCGTKARLLYDMPAEPTPKASSSKRRPAQSKRGAIACVRCKERKAKCVPAPTGTTSLPTCTNCHHARVTCVYLDRTPNELFLLE